MIEGNYFETTNAAQFGGPLVLQPHAHPGDTPLTVGASDETDVSFHSILFYTSSWSRLGIYSCSFYLFMR